LSYLRVSRTSRMKFGLLGVAKALQSFEYFAVVLFLSLRLRGDGGSRGQEDAQKVVDELFRLEAVFLGGCAEALGDHPGNPDLVPQSCFEPARQLSPF